MVLFDCYCIVYEADEEVLMHSRWFTRDSDGWFWNQLLKAIMTTEDTVFIK